MSHKTILSSDKQPLSLQSLTSSESSTAPSTGDLIQPIMVWARVQEVMWLSDTWLEFLQKQIVNPNLSEREIAYYRRISRVLAMTNLAETQGNPVNMIIDKVISAPFFSRFDIITVPEIVSEWETFDLFNFPDDHVARRPSDSYFIHKSSEKKKSILLRPHTSVMWYYYLSGEGKWILETEGEVRALSYGKVYRVDELDKTHHECFHQIDGLRISSKEKEIINDKTLRDVLVNTIKAIFWDDIKYRFNKDQFPYTTDSIEVEVEYMWKWLEVLGAWVVHPDVLEKLGIDPEKYNGWAFGFGIERLAMILKQIPDIRIFWSKDPRIIKQWWNFDPYIEISQFPAVWKDISFLAPSDKFMKDEKEMQKSGEIEFIDESGIFEVSSIARDVSNWLIESVKVVDMFENEKKFWTGRKSISIRLTFRSLERTLTNEEINLLLFQIRDKLVTELNYELR